MDQILIIHPGPLGQHSGTLFYCNFLKDTFQVNYVGIDEGNGFKNLDGVNQLHLTPIKNRFIRKIQYFKAVIQSLKKHNYKFILLNYFPLCSLLLLFNRSIVVEIRTSYIFNSKYKRKIYNTLLTCEVRLFRNITTLTDTLRIFLKLPTRTKIIPLGGPLINLRKINYDTLDFLYVGTLRQRNIHLTIEAFGIFLNNLMINETTPLKIQYHVIGFGESKDIFKINESIKKYNLFNHVFFHGEIRYPDLNNFFLKCNIGVSYVPQVEYFEMQPVTKTCEYLLNGMPVIATNLKEHQRIINKKNGVLINDNISDIVKGFEYIYQNRSSFSSLDIQKNSFKLSWEYIIKEIMIPYIFSIDENF